MSLVFYAFEIRNHHPGPQAASTCHYSYGCYLALLGHGKEQVRQLEQHHQVNYGDSSLGPSHASRGNWTALFVDCHMDLEMQTDMLVSSGLAGRGEVIRYEGELEKQSVAYRYPSYLGGTVIRHTLPEILTVLGD